MYIGYNGQIGHIGHRDMRSDVSSVHNIHPEHSDSVFAHFLASSDPISPTKLFRGPQTHANIH